MAVGVDPVDVPVGGADDRRGDRGDRALGDLHDVVEVVGGHRGDHELRGGGGRQRVGTGVHGHVVGPGHVDVAGQEDGVADRVRAQVGQQLTAVVRVAVPLVGVEGEALLRQPEQLRQRLEQVGGEGADGERRDHHRVADQPPGGVGGLQPGLQPVELGAAGDRTVRVVDRTARRGRLLGAEGAQVQQGQVGELAEAQPAVGGARDRRADRHPLEVGLLGGRLAVRPGALGALGVVVRAAGPGVVGELVVVPDRDDRRLVVQGLQIRVGLVLAVPGAVVGERDDLVGGRVRADDRAAGRVLAGLVLVDVVAEVQPGVQVATGREMAVRGEVAAPPSWRRRPRRSAGRTRRRPPPGAVRVRAAGESVPPAEKRNQ